MSAKLPGQADQLAGKRDGKPQPAVTQVEVQLLGMLGKDAFIRSAPDLLG